MPAPPTCMPPDSMLVGDRCVPSCGAAGGDSCDPAVCAGRPTLESYDCEVCCRPMRIAFDEEDGEVAGNAYGLGENGPWG
mgnify:CR=1 FL=1